MCLGFTGCSKYLDKLDDPNLVPEPPLNGVLVKVTYETSVDVFRMGNVVSYYTQYLSSNVRASDADIYNPVDYSTTWSNFYLAMMNIKQMNDLAASTGASHHLGVGKILLALNLNMLVNTFGDVPYSSALKGLDQLIPTFDNQAALHDTTISLLNQGIAELGKSSTVILDGQSDLIHKGDVNAWIKTAHALKARFLNQLSKKSVYSPTTILTEIDNAYKSNAEDAALTAFSGRSPWNGVAYNNTQLLLDGWLSTQLVDALNGTTYGVVDPRLAKIATITKFNDYRGTPNGAGRIGTGTNQEESYLSVNGYYSSGNAPLWLATYAEMKFIEAEAAFRSANPARAYTAYLEGIRSNLTKVGVVEPALSSYLTNPAVSVGQGALTLDLIFKEKYVAMFLNPESWVDARRYDYKYKDFTLPANAALSTFIRRLAYPTIETSRNGTNVPTITSLDQKLAFDGN